MAYGVRRMAYGVCDEARESSLFVFKLLAFLTESSVFLYLGLSVFGLGKQPSDTSCCCVFFDNRPARPVGG